MFPGLHAWLNSAHLEGSTLRKLFSPTKVYATGTDMKATHRLVNVVLQPAPNQMSFLKWSQLFEKLLVCLRNLSKGITATLT